MIFGDDKNIFSSPQGNNLKTAQPVDIQVDKFDGGVNVLLSEIRLKPNEAKEATNMMLAEDGVWKKRWGTKEYLTTGLFTADLDGFTEYRKTDGTRELIVIADGKAWTVDTTGKTEITGATFTSGYACDFAQISSYLYIVNGEDVMARYDGSTLSVYGSITTPVWDGTPLTRGAGLSAGSYNYYYRVSAVNEVGETLAAAEKTIAVDILRDDWDPTAGDEYIALAWDDVVGAKKYIVYMSDVSGYESKLAEVTTSAYQDDGSSTLNPYIVPPLASSVEGPKFKSIGIIGNRVWGTNDPANPQKVHWTGTDANLGNFAPAFDGGWIDLETGSRNQTTKVIDFNRKAHVICKTDDSRGSIWEIDFTTIEIASTPIIIPQATKLIAQMGTNAARSVVHVENDVFFINRFGVFTLGYEPNVFNVLRTKEQSVQIRPYIRDADESSMDKCAAYYYDSKVFFSIPVSSGAPNRIFLFDREKSAWIKDWTIGVSQFGEFTDTNGTTHFIGINGNSLIEFSENYEGDDGTAFAWKYISPRFPVSKDWTTFAFITNAFIRIRGAKGTPQFSFSGTTVSGASPTLGTDTIEQGSSDTGIGWDLIGSVKIGTTGGTPTFFAAESLLRYLQVDSLLRDIQWEISGDELSDTATIIGLMAEGRIVPTYPPRIGLFNF